MKTNPIKDQATELWETLSAKDTVTTYSQATFKSWELLKQSARLIFFLALLVVVIVVWLWSIAFQSGRSFRAWLEIEHPTPQQLLYKVGEILLNPFKFAADWSESQAKQLLGHQEVKAIAPAAEPKAISPAK